ELEVVKFLVAKRTNIYAERANGFKALNLAAMHGHKNIVEFFLNQELNVNDPDKDGWTSLHYVAQRMLRSCEISCQKGKKH
ncbi:ankyrin repeat domain-containing protein, partial [Wolbachia endosymbiont of Wuchereria bancrofti]|uniref:ankyrin repeat domain-containing protein n=1 Tax=Wolbachia endosymbiont of Wuchereria bancrofti TaxID=96496 RepID=UPI000B6D9A21